MDIYTRWLLLVSDYSTRKITKELDKLLTLLGLARKFANLTWGLYLAGIWKNNLTKKLVWTTGIRKRQSTYQAPTWSWCFDAPYVMSYGFTRDMFNLLSSSLSCHF